MATNRVRSRGPFLISNGSMDYEYRWNPTGTAWVIQSEGTAVSMNETFRDEVMYDTVTPKFFSRLKRGEIVSNPFTHRWRSYQRGLFNWSGSRPRIGSVPAADYHWHGQSYGPVSDPLTDSSGLLDNLIADCQTNVLAKANTSVVSGYVMLGELRQTIKLLKNPLGNLVGYVKRKSKSGKTAHNFYEQARNSWLTYRYGWRPVMQDIDDIMEATENRLRKRLTVRSTRSGSTSSERTNYGVAVMSHSGCTELLQADHSYEVRCGALLEVSPTNNYLAGMRIRDIPGAAWNLLPWSFVVDWFVNVNDYIEAVIPSSNTKIVTSWTVVDAITSQVQTVSPGQYSNYTNNPSGDVVTTYFLRTKSRAVGNLKAQLLSKQGSIQGLLSGADLRLIDTLALFTGKPRKGVTPFRR